jgi:hypothetical protein
MTAPLHERLMEYGNALDNYEGINRKELAALFHEAAAALRPPEGELGALCERLERRLVSDKGWPWASDHDLRAALAHLRRLASVEAERE